MDMYDNPFADDGHSGGAPPPPQDDPPAPSSSSTSFSQSDAGYDSSFVDFGQYRPQPSGIFDLDQGGGGGGGGAGADYAAAYADQPPHDDDDVFSAVPQGGYYQQYSQQYQPQQQRGEEEEQVFEGGNQVYSQEGEVGQDQEGFEQRRDSSAILTTSLEANKAAYEVISRHRSFAAIEPPYSKIEVSDPEKVEDYTTYKVVAISQDGKRTFLQQRRYQHFEYLNKELENKYPGMIVPPVPEKKAIGRFNAEFVETRRYFLESFLRRINKHPILMGSQDFRQFIETTKVEETAKSKGLLELVGGVFSDSPTTFSKSHESDKWHDTKRQEIVKLDGQLKKLQRKVETIVRQRKELGNTIASFWNDISSNREESDVFNSLSQLGSIQLKVEEVHQRESSQYVLNFGYTVDEYIRIIDSIKVAMNARATCCRIFHLANDKLAKKKDRLDKTMGQVDKGDAVTAIVQEVEQAQQEVDVSKKNFEEIDAVCQAELERFEKEMKLDFNNSMKAYVEKMVEAQQEITKWWSDFLPETHHF